MQSYILDIILLLTGLLGTYAIIPLFKNLLIESNVLRPNYKKDMIPVSMGIVFLPMIIINGIILAFFTKEDKNCNKTPKNHRLRKEATLVLYKPLLNKHI